MTLDELSLFDIGTMNPDAGKYYTDFGATQVPTPGAKIPTLEEVFDLINSYGDKKVVVNIELKSYADPAGAEYANNPDPEIVVKKIYNVVKKYNMEDRIVFQSFDWRPVKIMKQLDPNITVSALSDKRSLKPGAKEASPWLAGLNINDFDGDYIKAIKALGADMSTPEYKEVTPELVAEAHALGLKIIPWTVNKPEAMEKLIDMGVDGLITDKPWLVREVLANRGIPLPEPVVNVNSPYHTGTDIRNN
jgi:glycerophosphoryl diester phosphodiesterase